MCKDTKTPHTALLFQSPADLGTWLNHKGLETSHHLTPEVVCTDG